MVDLPTDDVRVPLTCEQVRAVDRIACERYGLSGLVLMENAGRGAAERIRELLPNPGSNRVLILFGPGNNGGDGLVVARHLANAGVAVRLVGAAPLERLRGDAASNARTVKAMGLPLVVADEQAGSQALARELAEAEVVVDALLGTGAAGAPRGMLARLIELANAAPRAWRVALDIPSGLDADSGHVHTPCFRADRTLTFVAPKVGFGAVTAGAVLGWVEVIDIGVPRTALALARAGTGVGESGKNREQLDS